MIPLITLLVVFTVSRLWINARALQDPNSKAARIALAVMLSLTGSAHFFSTEAMVQMLPSFVPAADLIIYVTGVLEIIAALLLLKPVEGPRPQLGWALALFLLALLPANIYSAIAERGLGGHGPAYLLFRVPLQGLFVGWALISTGAVQWPRLTVVLCSENAAP